MATFRNIATQTENETEKEYRAITPLQLIEMIQKLTNMLSIGEDDMILKVRNQALHTLDLCFKQCCGEPPIYKDYPPVRDADLAEQIAPKGDPGTSTAPCGRSSDRGGVVQRDVSDHQRAAELL